MQKKFLASGIVIVAVLVIAVLGWQFNPFQKPEPVKLGLAADLDYLTGIAIKKGFFEDAGLDVTLVPYPTGQAVMQEGILAGEVDAGIVGLTPLVMESFKRDDFKIITSTTTIYNLYHIAARRDHGIITPQDLRGKSIAVSPGTSFSYFLVNYLILNSLEGQVNITPAATNELAGALIAGEVDAAVLREPFVSEVLEALGDNAVIFGNPILPSNTFNLVALDETVDARPEAMERLVEALYNAQAFALRNPENAIELVSQYLAQDAEKVRNNWDNVEMQVGFRQELLLEMENIAHWAISSGLTGQTETPNYLSYLYYDALDVVAPGSITIIR